MSQSSRMNLSTVAAISRMVTLYFSMVVRISSGLNRPFMISVPPL